MHFFLVKKRNHDGTENKNPEKIRCKLSFGFDPIRGCEIAQALINNCEVAVLEDAKLYSVTEIGLYFKGSEKDDDGIYHQEWLCAYDENFTEETADMKMTQSYLFEGM